MAPSHTHVEIAIHMQIGMSIACVSSQSITRRVEIIESREVDGLVVGGCWCCAGGLWSSWSVDSCWRGRWCRGGRRWLGGW
jgi:hypothetical protein